MSERISLPSGAWVELRDPSELRRGDKKRALQMVPISEDMDLTLGTETEMTDGVLAVLITGWSFDLPLPVTAASLALLSLADGNALEGLDAVGEAKRLLFPQAPQKTEEQVKDPMSPTEPSAE
ncbi:hypothetical protein AB0912_15740 [Streptomyces sp. NPDC007084]|uniref:hypothetical protein n=1 Tax=Streptomyces sp. NPDC007084 TaxID=3154313 RepID=UPI0034543867